MTASGLVLKRIPVSGEQIPAIGLGTWQTFDVAPGSSASAARADVLREFLERGGRLVDSSPMYGRAEAAVGDARRRIGATPTLFSATKVWTSGKAAGIAQMKRSLALWDLPRFDLMQVHNLLDVQTHLATLREWKAQGLVRYIGITTSHGQREAETIRLIERERDVDFVQFSYSVADREAEARLLPAAMSHGKAVLVNLPFGTGALFAGVRGRPSSPVAAAVGCASWAQFFLKFVVAHPAVTCAIPATSSLEHLRDNLGALAGPLPDEGQRREMATAWNKFSGHPV